MNCKELQGLLITYQNGELKGPLKDLVEQHLEECLECSTALNEYRKIREKLLGLRQIESLPDLKEATMAELKITQTYAGLKRWLRPAVIAAPVIIMAVIVLSLQFTGIFDGPSGVMKKAYAASSSLDAYHYIKEEFDQDGPDMELVHSYHAEIEYTTPDRYRISTESLNTDRPYNPGETITIRIGDQAYTNAGYVVKREEESFERMDPSKDQTLEFLNILEETNTLEDELIDGTDCYHYTGTVDINKLLEWNRADTERMYYRMDADLEYGMSISLEEFVENHNESYLDQEITFECWIGKEDYLLRQARLVYQTMEGEQSTWNEYKTISLLKYTNFNKEILIEAPLDENGELLDGWSTYTVKPFEIPEEKEVVPGQRTPVDSEGLPVVINKSLASPIKVKTYRSVSKTYEWVDGSFEYIRTGVNNIGGHNLYCSKTEPTEAYKDPNPVMNMTLSYMVIGDKVYSLNFDPPPANLDGYDEEGQSSADTVRKLEQLYNTERLEDEEVNGTDCYHFRGIQDVEEYLEWFLPEYRKSFDYMNEMSDVEMDFDQSWKTVQNICRNQETIYDYWVGKDDYLVYRQIRTQRDLTPVPLAVDDLSDESTSQVITEYFDMDQPVTITPPLDESGNLLEGWIVTSLE
jgi:hypothetical protein